MTPLVNINATSPSIDPFHSCRFGSLQQDGNISYNENGNRFKAVAYVFYRPQEHFLHRSKEQISFLCVPLKVTDCLRSEWCYGFEEKKKGHPEASGPFGTKRLGFTTNDLGHQVASLAGSTARPRRPISPDVTSFHTQDDPFRERNGVPSPPTSEQECGRHPPRPSSPHLHMSPTLPEELGPARSLVAAPDLLLLLSSRLQSPAAGQDEPGKYGTGHIGLFLALA